MRLVAWDFFLTELPNLLDEQRAVEFSHATKPSQAQVRTKLIEGWRRRVE
jgi:hypothetical protein